MDEDGARWTDVRKGRVGDVIVEEEEEAFKAAGEAKTDGRGGCGGGGKELYGLSAAFMLSVARDMRRKADACLGACV